MATYIFMKLPDKDNHFDNTEVIIKCETSGRKELFEVFREFLLASGFQVENEIDELEDETEV